MPADNLAGMSVVEAAEATADSQAAKDKESLCAADDREGEKEGEGEALALAADAAFELQVLDASASSASPRRGFGGFAAAAVGDGHAVALDSALLSPTASAALRSGGGGSAASAAGAADASPAGGSSRTARAGFASAAAAMPAATPAAGIVPAASTSAGTTALRQPQSLRPPPTWVARRLQPLAACVQAVLPCGVRLWPVAAT